MYSCASGSLISARYMVGLSKVRVITDESRVATCMPVGVGTILEYGT